MAVEANVFSTRDAVGNREDLQDAIYDISPVETPIMSAIGTGRAKSRAHEWQTDVLAAAADNAVIEGDEASNDALQATTRLGNYTQLMDKVIKISSTQEVVDKAGRKSEMAYQVAKASKELKRDIELAISKLGGSVAGTTTTVARKMGGLGAGITTNESNFNDAAHTAIDGFAWTTYTPVTTRTFTETLLKDVMQSAYEAGGEPKLCITDPYNRRVLSEGFDGVVSHEKTVTGRSATIVGTVGVYASDFGDLSVIADRFTPKGVAYLLDPEYAEIAYLQRMKTETLAKTGHSDRRMLSAELTLCLKNEAAHGIIRDLNTTAP